MSPPSGSVSNDTATTVASSIGRTKDARDNAWGRERAVLDGLTSHGFSVVLVIAEGRIGANVRDDWWESKGQGVSATEDTTLVSYAEGKHLSGDGFLVANGALQVGTKARARVCYVSTLTRLSTH